MDDFYTTQIGHKIVPLDIITAQAANWASVLKNTLYCIQIRKAKRLEQLEIIAAIKNNNFLLEAIIIVDNVKLDCLYIQPIDSSNITKKVPL